MSEPVVIVPDKLDIELYGDSYPWSTELEIEDLGDLTDATIATKFQPDGGELTELLVTSTEEGLAASKFSIGYGSTVAGKYEIAITLLDGNPRTYVYGSIRVKHGVAT